MRNSGIFETKTHFSELIEQVLAGESISITRHGQEVARLIPPVSGPAFGVKEAIAGIQRLQKRLESKRLPPDEMSVSEMINWGRE